MSIQEIGLSWIVVKDIEASIEYYTKTVGLKLLEFNAKYGWAELQGQNGGPILGLAQENGQDGEKAGQNAITTFLTCDIESAKERLKSLGATFEGETLVVPGHVKMQTVIDPSGNRFQICEQIVPVSTTKQLH